MKHVVARMTKKSMPQVRTKGDEGSDCGGGRLASGGDRVEVSRTIAPHDWGPRTKILHKKIKRVKLDSHVIIDGKLTNRNEVFNKVRGKQDFVEA